MWVQAIGIDTMFESPWYDMQNLGLQGIYQGLVAMESDGVTVTGILATDWTVSDDGLTYKFNIRPNVKWHDGETLTPEEVAYSMSAAAVSPVCQIGSTTLRQIVGAAEAAEAAGANEAATVTLLPGITYDDTSVTCQLVSANKMFLIQLGEHRVLPMHLYMDRPLIDFKAFDTLIGTGPYKVDKVQFPDYYTAVAFEDYWGEQPGIKEMIMTSYYAGGDDAAINAMITGDLDIVYGNAMNDISVANNIVAQNPDATYAIQSSSYNRKLMFNFNDREDGKTKQDLKKKEVRQAFNMLLDKDALASVYAGQAEGLTTFVPNSNPYYNSDIPNFKRDVEGAKALLDAAGFDYSQVYDIYSYYTDQNTTDLLAYMKQNFADAGVQVEIHQVDTGTWATVSAGRNFDINYGSNGARTNAVQLYETVCGFFSQNRGLQEERSALYDADYKAWLATSDEAAARQYSDRLQASLLDFCDQIPVYAMNTIVTYNAKRLTVPENLFAFDNQTLRNWHWSEWKINE